MIEEGQSYSLDAILCARFRRYFWFRLDCTILPLIQLILTLLSLTNVVEKKIID